MAASVVSIAISSVNESRRQRIRTAKIVFAAGDYVTGGMTLNLTTVTNPSNFPCAKFGQNPTNAELMNTMPGYTAKITRGTNLTNWLLQFYQTGASSGTALTEVAAGAMPAAIVASTDFFVNFFAVKNI